VLQQKPSQFKFSVAPFCFRITRPKTIDGVVVILDGLVKQLLARKQAAQGQIHRTFLGRTFPQADEIGFGFGGASGVAQRPRQAELVIKIVMGIAEGCPETFDCAFRLPRTLRLHAVFVEMAGQRFLLFAKTVDKAIDP